MLAILWVILSGTLRLFELWLGTLREQETSLCELVTVGFQACDSIIQAILFELNYMYFRLYIKYNIAAALKTHCSMHSSQRRTNILKYFWFSCCRFSIIAITQAGLELFMWPGLSWIYVILWDTRITGICHKAEWHLEV